MENESGSSKGFVPRYLPWVVAGGMLVVYLVTVRSWTTFGGLAHLSRTFGWEWHPTYVAPLYYVLSYPFRWVPGGMQILGLNLFSVVCSVLSIALLARSVALLPHDRTRDQRQFERSDDSRLSVPGAWIPPLLAALVCGLQLTFWENAVMASGEALDLLLFAYVLRCLLEHRVDQRDSWLVRMAFVYGLGITNNFAMIAFLPALLLALFWIKGLSLLNFRLCLRMALCGLAALSLYFVLPTVQSFSDVTSVSFFEALKMNLGFEKSSVMSFPRFRLLLIGLTSLMPVFFIGIKWPAQFGDISAVGNALTNVMTHLIHVVFFVACIYVAFDPPFSPRKLGFGYPFLPIYYLGALSIGYFAGYFLLVFNPRRAVRPTRSWEQPSGLRMAFSYFITAVVWISLLGVPAGLLYKNAPEIQHANSRSLSVYAETAARSLPDRAVVLSDDLVSLYALFGTAARSGSRKDWVLVESKSLTQPGYHRHLRKLHPQRWPSLAASYPLIDRVPDPTVLETVVELSRSNAVFYLHPSFGYFFEQFHLVPHQLVYELRPYPADTVSAPPLAPEAIKENDDFWTSLKQGELKMWTKPAGAKKQKLEPNSLATFLKLSYSQRLNQFGVELQRSGDSKKAGEYFGLALEAYPDNPAAFINLDYNRLFLAGQRVSAKPSEGAIQRLAPYNGDWNTLLSVNGPVDEPNSCFLLAEILAKGRNARQAAQQLERILVFNPENRMARIGLVSMYVQIRFYEQGLNLIRQIRADAVSQPLTPDEHLALVQSEAWTYAGRNELGGAEKVLQTAQQSYPQYSAPFSTMSEIYLAMGQLTNAMGVLEAQMKVQPENVNAIINYGALKRKAGDVNQSIAFLNNAVKIQPQNTYALINRAMAYLESGKLDLAESDFEALRKILPKPIYAVSYGLGEIAYQKKRRKEALTHYKDFLTLAPPGTPEVNVVRDRVKKLEKGTF